jgi:hypothetical protein
MYPGTCCAGDYLCCQGSPYPGQPFDPASCAFPTGFLVGLGAGGAFLWQRGGPQAAALDPCGAVIAVSHLEVGNQAGTLTVERIVP